MTENNAAQPGLTDDQIEAVRRVLEPYAESYDMMTRMADREGKRPTVSTTAVAIDIRGNMIPGVIAALSKLRAEGVQAGDEREVAGVTLDGCLETLFRVGEHLGIDYADSRKQSGAPSGVYIKAIEDRVSQASNAAREEAAKLMDQTSRSSGAVLIRSLASAPVAEPEDTREDFDIWCKKHGYASSGSINMLWSAWREALKHASAPVADANLGLLRDARHRIANLSRAEVPFDDPLDGPVLRRLDAAIQATASAPVADLRHELNQLGVFAHTALNLDERDMRNNLEDLADRLLALAGGAPTLSAPVAGEAQKPVAWRYHAEGDPTKWYYSDTESLLGLYQPLYAAPQASEAVRMGDVKAIAREVAADGKAIRAEARNAALEEAVHTLWLMRSRPEFEPDEKDKLLDRAMASIRARKTHADKDGGDCAKGGAEVGADSPESRASAYGTVVLPPLPKPFDTVYLEGEECPIYGAGQMQAYARTALAAQKQGDSDAG